MRVIRIRERERERFALLTAYSRVISRVIENGLEMIATIADFSRCRSRQSISSPSPTRGNSCETSDVVEHGEFALRVVVVDEAARMCARARY